MSKTESNQSDMVRVASAGSNEEASILRSYLEHHEIHVYVQGENHRSMLGMVGAYIDLNIMVPTGDVAEARRLLEEFHAADTESADAPETRGPFRDEDEDEDEEDEAHSLELECRRKIRGARMVGLFVPFGTAHIAAGSKGIGAVFVLASLAGLALGASQNPTLAALWFSAFALDFLLVPWTVRRRMLRSSS